MKPSLIMLALVLTAVLPFVSSSQIPNPGFENWTGTNPDNWETTNNVQFQPITKTTTAHSGSFAVQGTVVDIGFGFKLSPILTSGSNSQGFPVSSRPAALQGYYQFVPTSGDNLFISVVFKKRGGYVAAGIFGDTLGTSVYKLFSIPIEYSTGEVPDSAIITALILGPSGSDYHAGSNFLLDDLSFSGTVAGVASADGLPQEFSLRQNYPNPFNPGTTISYTLPSQSRVLVRISNILGQELQTLVDEVQPAGVKTVTWNAGQLPSGIYLYRLDATSSNDPGRSFSQVRRMLLVK